MSAAVRIPSSGSGRYNAFISYSQHADKAVAQALQSELAKYAKPFYRSRALRIFRDTTNTIAGHPSLWAAIVDALERSEWFILIASPASAASYWVNEEVMWWLANRSSSRMMIALVGGEIAGIGSSFDPTRTDALPRRMLTEIGALPYWVDLRSQARALAGDEAQAVATGRDPIAARRLGDIVADFAAPIHGREKDEMVGENVKAAKLLRRVVRSTIAVLSALLAVATVAAVYANQQRRQADTQRVAAVAAQRTATSRQLAAQSSALLTTEPDLGSLLAVAAYRSAGTTEATNSLFAAAALPLKQRLPDPSTGEDQIDNANVGVTAVAFSPDGHFLAAGSGLGRVRIFDTTTGKLDESLPPSQSHASVASLAYSPDGQTLAVDTSEFETRLWNVRDHTIRLLDQDESGHAIAYGPDGTVAVITTKATVELWNATTAHLTATLTGMSEASAIAFSPTGHTLAVASGTGKLAFFDGRSARLQSSLTDNAGNVQSLAYAPDGRSIGVGDKAGTTRIWDVDTDKVIRTIDDHTGGTILLAYSPDGHTVAIADSAGIAPSGDIVRFVDLTSGASHTLPADPTVAVSSLAFSPDGRTLATGSADGSARLWDVALPGAQAVLPSDGGTVHAVAFSPDGRTIASGHDDGTARLWNIATGHASVLDAHTHPEDAVTAVAFTPSGHALVTGTENGTVWLWNLPGTSPRRLNSFSTAVRSLSFNPDGSVLAVATDGGLVGLLNPATGAGRVLTSTGATFAVFSPVGNSVATGGQNQATQIWDLRSGTSRQLAPDTRSAFSLAYSPDGHVLALRQEYDGVVRLVTVSTGDTDAMIAPHGGFPEAMAYGPDGSTLAISQNGSLQLWNIITQQIRDSFAGHTGPIESIAFSADGRTMASGSDDTSVRTWSVNLLNPGQAAARICQVAARDLSAQERSTYMPDEPDVAVCPGQPR